MASIEVKTDIRSLLDFYREERRIYGRCPQCGEAFRLSEAKLTYGKEPPRDLLTRLKQERDRLDGQIEQLEGTLDEMRTEHKRELDVLTEHWETKLDSAVDKGTEKRIAQERKKIRLQAIQQSRVTTLGKTIERVAPMFSGFGHHPGDVRALFDPIDFVVFQGLWAGEVSGLVFMEFKTGGAQLTRLQKSIRTAVDRKRIRFEERRISTETLRRIADGTAPSSRSVIEARDSD